jgi:hypothetical protein
MKQSRILNQIWVFPSTLFALPRLLYQRYHVRQADGYRLEATLRRQRLQSEAIPLPELCELRARLWARDYDGLDWLDFMTAYHTARAQGTSIPDDYHGPEVRRPW